MLSDLRLNKSKNIPDLEKSFLGASVGAYQFRYNSTKNSRGVGILIKNSLGLTVNYVFNDNTENILGLNISLGDQCVNIVSIYGPNSDDMSFFVDLHRFMTMFPDCPTIIGGDWNATFSLDNSVNNIDIFRMLSPPSITRSRAIAEICETYKLTDPFRTLCTPGHQGIHLPAQL